jgi:hypothetical protein
MQALSGLSPDVTHLLIALVAAAVGAALKFFIPIWWDNYKYKNNKRLVGEWKSVFQQAGPDRTKWSSENVRIFAKSGKVQLVNSSNADGFEWEGSGELYGDSYFYGTWRSTREESAAKGAFIFFLLTEGRTIVGHTMGPDARGVNVSVHWVMGRDDAAVELGKRWLTEQLSETAPILTMPAKQP